MKLLTTKEVAERLGISEAALAIWRSTGRVRLPFVRIGRAVRYRPSDIEEWLARQTVNPTHAQTSERD